MIGFIVVLLILTLLYLMPYMAMLLEECVMKIPKEDFRTESPARKEFRQKYWWWL